MRNSNKRNQGKNTISNVRVVDEEDGQYGIRVDRMITFVQNSHSQTRVLCQTSNLISLTASDQFFTYDTAAIRAYDDFVSLAAQYSTYRVTAIKFEVYDVAPNTLAPNGFSTFHDTYATAPTFNFGNIADGPDFRIVAPGTGKVTLHWLAKGTQENDFQSTRNTGTGITDVDFGGIRAYVGAGTVGVNKYQVVVKAIVDFRGRF